MQNVVILHFFENIFAHIKKKQYLCTVKLKFTKTFIYKQKNYTTMTSLKKFYCKCAKIELLILDVNEIEDCLYIVNEEPRRKKSKWQKATYKYLYTEDAHDKFLELVTFWCK